MNRKLSFCGLFTLPDTNSDSDSQPDGYYTETVPIARTRTWIQIWTRILDHYRTHIWDEYLYSNWDPSPTMQISHYSTFDLIRYY